LPTGGGYLYAQLAMMDLQIDLDVPEVDLLVPRPPVRDGRLVSGLRDYAVGHGGEQPAYGDVRLAAQYAESAVWLQQDLGDLDRAQSWPSQAMEWTYETGDESWWRLQRRAQRDDRHER
jgi:hypothetical protein